MKYITVDRTWLDEAAEEGYVAPPIKIAFDDGRETIAVYGVDFYSEEWGAFKIRYSPDGAPVGNPRFVWIEVPGPITVQHDLRLGGLETIE